MRWIPIAIGLLFADQALADDYSKFYVAYPDATPQMIAATRVAPAPDTPNLERRPGPPGAVIEELARKGYGAIGYSSFNSGKSAKDKGALKQGQRVGADLVVVIDPTFTGSQTRNIPLTLPTTQTTYSSGTATVFGSGGTATVYGNGTSTTHGTTTTNIPITTNRFDYGALYFVKRKYLLGVNGRDPTDAERIARQRNGGVVVQLVVDGTPAFVNDILPGDFLEKINGQVIAGQRGLSDVVQPLAGQIVDIEVTRGSEVLHKSIRLGKY